MREINGRLSTSQQGVGGDKRKIKQSKGGGEVEVSKVLETGFSSPQAELFRAEMKLTSNDSLSSIKALYPTIFYQQMQRTNKMQQII